MKMTSVHSMSLLLCFILILFLHSSFTPIQAQTITQNFVYALHGTGYQICAYGSFITGSLVSSGNYFPLLNMTGSRTFINLTTGASVTQSITGIASVGADGSDDHVLASYPYVDQGGITYTVNGNTMFPTGATGTAGSLNNNWVNIWNMSPGGPVFIEDGYAAVDLIAMSGPAIIVSNSTTFSLNSCQAFFLSFHHSKLRVCSSWCRLSDMCLW